MLCANNSRRMFTIVGDSVGSRIFMNVSADPAGRIPVAVPPSRAGDWIDLRAEMAQMPNHRASVSDDRQRILHGDDATDSAGQHGRPLARGGIRSGAAQHHAAIDGIDVDL